MIFDPPYRLDVDARVASLIAEYAGLEDGEETERVVTIAGRVMLLRDQGKLAFATLREGDGSEIQLFALSKVLDGYDEFVKLNLGDWVGATGTVVKTRRGELSVKITSFVHLAEARRGFGDKFHGINDTDIRYRQRYADLWANPESAVVLRTRSRIMSLTRRWLEDREFVEVETPVLQHVASGAAATPFTTHHNALDVDLKLRIAPELFLKRLVVGGFERVFEIGRVFRNEGISTRHNPEFTMLELYQAYADYADIMTLVEDLVAHLAIELHGTTTLTYGDRELDLSTPWRRASMVELIEDSIGVRLDVNQPIDDVRKVAVEHDVEIEESWGTGKLILEIYEKTTESSLWGPIFVTDYPEEVSPLSRSHRELPGVTERFEAIVAGRELCNAFSELTDPDVQRARFEDQVRQHDAGDHEAMPLDEDYLRAMEYGLPPTGGLGIGMDRLVMLLTDTPSIRDVVLFPTLRPEQ
ncbi:lysine--tRNA ligase [Actinospongicola halichondriae]|uniref:lysine--tRNA ligase n=1 Tax=Actinospongicola halichondriae TaxID=3236844 RepID=UPI003D4DA430